MTDDTTQQDAHDTPTVGVIENTTSTETETETEPPMKAQPDNEQTAQFIATVATWIDESEPAALWQIRRIVHKAGPAQTMALLKEVLAVEEQGGMKTGDQSRRRSIGGVFFYLAKGKGYLPFVKQKKKPGQQVQAAQHGQPDVPTGTPTHAAPPPRLFQWKDRRTTITDLQQEQGAANVKITLIGRPGRIADHGAFILTTMQSNKVPSFPKGLPAPASVSTTYSVYIASKQWKKVEASLRHPEDVLIAEGYPMLDKETETIAVFVTSTGTKLLQAAAREQQQGPAAQG